MECLGMDSPKVVEGSPSVVAIIGEDALAGQGVTRRGAAANAIGARWCEASSNGSGELEPRLSASRPRTRTSVSIRDVDDLTRRVDRGSPRVSEAHRDRRGRGAVGAELP